MAISWFCWPLAASKTICARRESLTLVSRDWDNFVSAPRSSSVNPRNRSYPLEIRHQPKQDKHLTAISGVTQWVKQNAETSIAKNPNYH
ncbi:MAG: hypothetical protein PHV02_21695, partial [Rhodocyclaceae bacterium]|nr:hypothetical protein [Rhodocyclaceae bacterium]